MTFEIKPWASQPKDGPAGEWVLFTDTGRLSPSKPLQGKTKTVNIAQRKIGGRLYKMGARCSFRLSADRYQQQMQSLEQLGRLLANGYTVDLPFAVHSMADWQRLEAAIAQPTPPAPPF